MKSKTSITPSAVVPAATRLLLAVLLTLVGCEVTPEKVEVWKNSVNGAPKLRAAVRDTGQKIDVRVLAAEALVELGHLGPLGEDLKHIGKDKADQTKVVNALVGKLMKKMKGQGSGRAQLSAKDALFSLRPYLSDAKKTEVTKAMISWMLADWARRSGGDHSGPKIVQAAGAAAGPAVADAVANDPERVVELANLLAAVGSAADKKAGTAKLIELGKKKPSAAVFEAIGKVKDASGRAFLVSEAQTGEVKKRQMALLSLKLTPNPSLIKPMAALAGNAKEEGELRDAAFSVLEKVKKPETADALLPMLSDSNKIVRYRTAEALVSCCGSAGVAKLLGGLSSKYPYEKDDVKDYLQKVIQGLGKSVLPTVRKALASESWIARLVAVQVLGEVGTISDLPGLQKLTSDKTKLKHESWGKGATLGAVALAAVARVKKRGAAEKK
ncbi:MAG: hypothetical protein KC503_29135 [Myxococcales bacterium]|nr:hypothetical protein [Myxococcales bacterium]